MIVPTFNFDGRCEEAMGLYEKAFGAETRVKLRYSDADPRDWDKPLSEAQKRLIYHAEMRIGDQRLFLSDIVEFGLSKGTGVFLTVTFEAAEGVRKAYEVLKEGSTTLTPLSATTYSACLASFIDKFGVRWGLLTEAAEG